MLIQILQIVLGAMLLIRIGGILSKKLKDEREKIYRKFKNCVLASAELMLLVNYHKSIMISPLLCIISLLYIACFILESLWRFYRERKNMPRKEYVIFVITGMVCLAVYVLYTIICVNVIFFDKMII